MEPLVHRQELRFILYLDRALIAVVLSQLTFRGMAAFRLDSEGSPDLPLAPIFAEGITVIWI